MKAEAIEKGDGTILVRYTATTPYEALILSMAALGTDTVSVSASGGYGGGKGSVGIGSLTLSVIEQLTTPTETASSKTPASP